MPTTKRPSAPSEPKQTVEWRCQACNVSLSGPEMKNHLIVRHGLAEPHQGTREVDFHADGPTHYVWVYRWNIGGVVAQEIVTTERSQQGKEMWS